MAPSGTVLLVNSFDGRDNYADHLRAAGLIVFAADTPEAALTQLDTVDPHVVVTDFVFPRSGFDGASCIRTLRKRIDRATSIIVVSTFARQADREIAQAEGADLYLVKPALPAAVLYEVQRALILRRSGRRLVWNWRAVASVPARAGLERRQSKAS